MNKYTLEDIQLLGQIFDQTNELQNLDEEDRIKFTDYFSSISILNNTYKETRDLYSTLMSFLGHNKGAGTTTEKWNALHTFLFKTSLKKMTLHLNDSGEYSWRSIVAKWRLQIRK